MPLKGYGVLKGTPVGHLRDADDDHYQILIKAGSTVYRIAANVRSASKEAPSELLFQHKTSVPDTLKRDLRKLDAEYKKVPSKAGGLAQDLVRGGLATPAAMKPVPPDAPGADNDLKDKLEDAIVKAIGEAGSVVYAFGQRWGPEKTKRDKYFGFLPGNGIHDIHMNQGNLDKKYRKDDGVYQDGALYIEYPGDKWQVFYLAFQSQTFKTDDEGHAVGVIPPKKKKQPKKSPKKKPGKKPKKKKPKKEKKKKGKKGGKKKTKKKK